jgi:nucleotide-binding universal stress UspA family protein
MNIDVKESTTRALQPVAIEKILVAYDASEPSDRALDLAIRLAKSFSGSLAILSVVPQRPGRAGADPWDDTELHHSELAAAHEVLRGRDIEARFILKTGDVPGTIERTITEGGFDTVVLGSRGMGWAGRTLQGSVSEHVATHSRATVIVIH